MPQNIENANVANNADDANPFETAKYLQVLPPYHAFVTLKYRSRINAVVGHQERSSPFPRRIHYFVAALLDHLHREKP